MIDVTVIETGDTAEADTPEAALLAALTIGREAKQHVARQGFNPTILFEVEGEPVRKISLRELTR